MMGTRRLVGWTALVLAIGATASGTAAVVEKRPKAPVTRIDRVALSQLIDREIEQRLVSEKVKPSPVADDAEFLRRAYLDITGVIPSPEKAAEFLDSKDPQKRARLIDELLASPAYGRHMADIWQALLLPRNSDNRRLQSEPMGKWLEEHFNNNTPWDKFVSELISATGPQDKNGAVTFYLANPTPDKVTDTVSKLFLGVQLQCAQCHNHPFTHWKQTEYWGMAAFFMKVRPDNVRGAAKKGNTPGVIESATAPKGKNKLPESAKIVPARFFQGEEPALGKSEPYRPVLAKWLTAPDNPFFARAMVNRMWAHFFGKGIVNPVDDMHEANAPSHPALLNALADQFVASQFDLKELIRAICNSTTYQRTSKPNKSNEGDTVLFSHMTIKPLAPEQLYDSLVSVVGAGRGTPAGNRKAAQQKTNGPNNPRAQFVNFFMVEEGADPTEYQAGIPQALRLMNSPQLASNPALLGQLERSAAPEKVIERLYLATLSRRPTPAEMERSVRYVREQGSGDVRKAHSDLLWALLNCSEFALNH